MYYKILKYWYIGTDEIQKNCIFCNLAKKYSLKFINCGWYLGMSETFQVSRFVIREDKKTKGTIKKKILKFFLNEEKMQKLRE